METMRQLGPKLLVVLCVTFSLLDRTPAEAAAAAASKTVPNRYYCTPAAKRDTGNDPFSGSSDDVTSIRAEHQQPMCFTSLFACLLMTKNRTACVMKSPADVDPYWDSGKRDVSAAALPYDVNRADDNPEVKRAFPDILTVYKQRLAAFLKNKSLDDVWWGREI